MLAWAALAGTAQEIPPRPEKLPAPAEPIPTPPPAPVVEACPKPSCPVPQALWYERDIPVQILEAREVVQEDRVPTLAIVLHPEKRVVTDVVMKPREVTREVCYTALEPCTVTDPCTGECSTVLKPVPRTRVQKDLEFVAVAQERTVVVQVPFLKEVEEVVPRKTVLLEYKTVLEKKGFAVGIPGEAAPPTRYLVPPPPAPCFHAEHP
jgi:hypothetical protein